MIKETKDRLTDIFVQKYFEARLEEEIARSRRYKHHLSVLMFEVDFGYFMPNESVRWMMMYTIYRQFGVILKNNLRNVDIPARYKNEQFVVMLPETPLEGARIVAERIRNDLQNFEFEGFGVFPKIRVAADSGIVCIPMHGKTKKEILISAEAALFRSKELGGNVVAECPQVLYNDDWTSRPVEAQKEEKPAEPSEAVEKIEESLKEPEPETDSQQVPEPEVEHPKGQEPVVEDVQLPADIDEKTVEVELVNVPRGIVEIDAAELIETSEQTEEILVPADMVETPEYPITSTKVTLPTIDKKLELQNSFREIKKRRQRKSKKSKN